MGAADQELKSRKPCGAKMKVCVWVGVCVCVCVYGYPQQTEGSGSPRAGVTGGFELPNLSAEN